MEASIKKQIKEGISLGIKAKALAKEAKGLKEQSVSILLPLMTAYDLKKYEVNGLGKATVKVSHGLSINRDKLKEQLLLDGMSIKKIEKIIKASSKSWSTEYVEVR